MRNLCIFVLQLIIAETIDKIIHFLSNANNVASRRYCGLSNIEIADALTKVAVNDDNKKMVSYVMIYQNVLFTFYLISRILLIKIF